ncbi:winged helix-turn-helix domain-containing protein [Candidatus Woesearchaeota archaeon]|nr:winged helix-turn-helix domain-containing protein [Candidatus Woesearchaeota archaeon]
MGQQEIYDFLKKSKEQWFTTKQISESLELSRGSVTACLKKLRKSGLVLHRPTGVTNQYEYKFKK